MAYAMHGSQMWPKFHKTGDGHSKGPTVLIRTKYHKASLGWVMEAVVQR